MATDGQILFRGTHGPYSWLTSTEHYMCDLVRLCPDLVLNRHIAVTAIDSGRPFLTDLQKARGWEVAC